MDSELAWAASFIETDGSIGVANRAKFKAGTDKCLQLKVSGANNDRRRLERLQAAFGGLGTIHAPRKTTADNDHYRWSCVSRQAEAVVNMIFPYLTPGTREALRAERAIRVMKVRPRKLQGAQAATIGPELGRVSQFKDLTTLRRNFVQSMLFGTLENRGIDYVAGIDCIRYANILTAESAAYDFDVGRGLWLNRSRWTRLVRQYLDPSETARFLDRAADIGLGEGKRGVITEMSTASIRRESKKHRWGACCLGFTYRGLRTGKGLMKPTISMHSRVSYVAYIGALDLALPHVLAREIGRRIEVPVEDFRVEWHLGAAQLHAFKSLPMLYSDGWMSYFEQEKMRQRYPSIKLIGKWHDQVVRSTDEDLPLDKIKYGPLRRVTRRYREYLNEDFLPNVPISSLTLAPLTR